MHVSYRYMHTSCILSLSLHIKTVGMCPKVQKKRRVQSLQSFIVICNDILTLVSFYADNISYYIGSTVNEWEWSTIISISYLFNQYNTSCGKRLFPGRSQSLTAHSQKGNKSISKISTCVFNLHLWGSIKETSPSENGKQFRPEKKRWL